MRFTLPAIAAFVLAVANCSNSRAATYSPVLGDLLSGDSVSSAEGAHNPFNIYQTDFVNLNHGSATEFTRSTGNTGIQNGDTITVVSAFSSLGSSMISGTTSALGTGGFGALVWTAQVTNATNNAGGGSFGITARTGGVGNVLSNAGTGSLSLLVSETLDFSSASLADINTGIGGAVTEFATFEFEGDTDFSWTATTAFGSSNTKLTADFNIALDVVTTPAEFDFWSLTPTGLFSVAPTPANPYASNGRELFLNYGDGVNTVIDGINFATTSSTAGTSFAATGQGSAAMNPVPEPSALLALSGCIGFAGLVSRRRRRSEKTA